MKNVMLDLETMGSESNAAIISIGAVDFDESGIGDGFYAEVSLASSVDAGLRVSPSTVIWWMRQSDDARSRFIKNGEAGTLRDALIGFSEWYVSVGGAYVWGCGCTFDNVILSNAFAAAGMNRPWTYKGDRCYRTLRDLYPEIPVDRVGVEHDALDDARTQALHAIKILNRMDAWDSLI